MTDLPVEVELRRVRLPLVTPHVTWSTELDEREVLLVRVELEGGGVGWGECPTFPTPTYTSEYTDGAWAFLRDLLVPALLRFPPGPRGTLVGHPMAKGALADACDAADTEHFASVAARLASGWNDGRPLAATVPTTAVLSGWTDLDDLLARAARAIAHGASAIKVKLARDLDPLWALRSTYPSVLLAADVNGLYEVGDEDDELLAEIDKLGLVYLEQPYEPAAGWDGLLSLRGRIDTPIALDESIVDLASAQAALLLGATIINVKPARVGGGVAAADIIEECEQAGAGAFVGGMLETGIGRAHALAVAALPGCTLPTDLGPSSRYFAEDLTEPFELNPDGSLTVPTGPGLGRVPDPDRLEAATVDRLVLRR